MKNITKISLALASGALVWASLRSLVSIPSKAKAVKPFNPKRYLGRWFEIARLDMRFERNMNNVTAEYALNPNGSIHVFNQGYNYVKNKWKHSVGKAKFVNGPDEGRLKVSFFGPFYSGYNVIAVDEDYQYALVAGSNLAYLWILSRSTTIPEQIKKDYLSQAERIGYRTRDLIWGAHDR